MNGTFNDARLNTGETNGEINRRNQKQVRQTEAAGEPDELSLDELLKNLEEIRDLRDKYQKYIDLIQ